MPVMKRLSVANVGRAVVPRKQQASAVTSVAEAFDAEVMFARTMRRFPVTMAKLAE